MGWAGMVCTREAVFDGTDPRRKLSVRLLCCWCNLDISMAHSELGLRSELARAL
jgi:hypothetical protein